MKTHLLFPPKILEYGAIVIRCLLGVLFIYTGLQKALDPVDFLKLVRQYELVDSPLFLNAVAAALPWFEVFCGGLLFAGIAVRGTALALIAMLAPFTVIVLQRALTMQAAQGITFCAVRFNCGCGMGEVWICNKLIENSFLILLAAWLLTGYGRSWSARYDIWRRTRV